MAREAGKKKLAVPRKEIAADFYREIEGKVFAPLAKAMRIHDKLENYESVETTLKELVAAIPETEAERRSDAKAIFKELKEKVLREEVLTHGVRLDGRKFDEIRPIWIETGVLPAHSWIGRLHAWRNAGACHLHARHGRRRAEDRDVRRRDVEELHAPLQLPALLGR